MESLKQALIIGLGCLIAAGFGGFTLLKAYDEFRKGLEKNNRLRIWVSFSMVVFLFLITLFVIKGKTTNQALGTSLPTIFKED